MKTLIINGSPRKNGDTMFLVERLKTKLGGTFEVIDCYFDDVSPCTDCRFCWKNSGCGLKDDMAKVYADDYDVVVIASPVYCSNVTPPLFGLITRLNYLYSNKHFLNVKHQYKPKTGILILVGGGDGEPDSAMKIVKSTFKKLNADWEENQVFSLSTNNVETSKDEIAISKIDEIVQRLKTK